MDNTQAFSTGRFFSEYPWLLQKEISTYKVRFLLIGESFYDLSSTITANVLVALVITRNQRKKKAPEIGASSKREVGDTGL